MSSKNNKNKTVSIHAPDHNDHTTNHINNAKNINTHFTTYEDDMLRGKVKNHYRCDVISVNNVRFVKKIEPNILKYCAKHADVGKLFLGWETASIIPVDGANHHLYSCFNLNKHTLKWSVDIRSQYEKIGTGEQFKLLKLDSKLINAIKTDLNKLIRIGGHISQWHYQCADGDHRGTSGWFDRIMKNVKLQCS